jgi:hypothetical protein
VRVARSLADPFLFLKTGSGSAGLGLSNYSTVDMIARQGFSAALLVVIVIEKSDLCLSIPNFDTDYDKDNDKEIGGESAASGGK